MLRRHLLNATIVAVALVLPLAGCGGKFKMTAKQMCEAHGGTYSAQGQHCDYTAKRIAAKQSCESQGGVYWPAEQYCEFEAGR
jgi:hypothetical protein